MWWPDEHLPRCWHHHHHHQKKKKNKKTKLRPARKRSIVRKSWSIRIVSAGAAPVLGRATIHAVQTPTRTDGCEAVSGPGMSSSLRGQARWDRSSMSAIMSMQSPSSTGGSPSVNGPGHGAFGQPPSPDTSDRGGCRVSRGRSRRRVRPRARSALTTCMYLYSVPMYIAFRNAADRIIWPALDDEHPRLVVVAGVHTPSPGRGRREGTVTHRAGGRGLDAAAGASENLVYSVHSTTPNSLATCVVKNVGTLQRTDSWPLRTCPSTTGDLVRCLVDTGLFGTLVASGSYIH